MFELPNYDFAVVATMVNYLTVSEIHRRHLSLCRKRVFEPALTREQSVQCVAEVGYRCLCVCQILRPARTRWCETVDERAIDRNGFRNSHGAGVRSEQCMPQACRASFDFFVNVGINDFNRSVQFFEGQLGAFGRPCPFGVQIAEAGKLEAIQAFSNDSILCAYHMN